MFTRRALRALGTSGVFAGAMAALLVLGPHRGQAQMGGGDDESKVQQGFRIAPVPLKLAGRNRAMVGLGSYIVNAQSACLDCHTWPSYAPGGDPFLGQPKQVSAAAYMGGGRVFFGPVVSRNLTPDKTGLPGGASWEEFRAIMKTGVDPDAAHPGLGPYLQVMPWPVYQDMTERDLRAVYEYLRAIPCVEGDPGLPNPRPPGTRCQ